MNIEKLLVEVRQNRPEAQATAARLGPDASPALVPLTTDQSAGIRSMALLCLSITGGTSASDAALQRLSDDDQVVAQALLVLRKHPPYGREAELLQAYRKPSNPSIREDLPLIAGRLAPKIDPQPWLEFWQREKAPELRESLMVGLARMGNAQAREQFVQALSGASGEAVVHWLDHARYMEDTWIVPHLLPLLDRTKVAIRLNPDGENTWPLRTCDLAARAILDLTKATVAFEVQRPAQFTDQELEEVRRIGRQVKK